MFKHFARVVFTSYLTVYQRTHNLLTVQCWKYNISVVVTTYKSRWSQFSDTSIMTTIIDFFALSNVR